MSKKQLFALSFSNLVIWIVGTGLLPLLPVYATRLGATSAVAGYYMSIAFIALFTGTIIAGWLSDRFQHRKIIIIVSGVLNVPVIWLMGRATDIWQLTVITAPFWLLGGLTITLLTILTGLSAEKGKRGKSFGFLSITGPLGVLISGISTGPMADFWGYSNMFIILSIFYCLAPLAALFLKDKKVERVFSEETSGLKDRPGLESMFYILFLSTISASVISFAGRLGISLVMNDSGFTATAISSTGAVGGAVALPIAPFIGWLSDRMARTRILMFFYLSTSTGILVLTMSTQLWHFWIASSIFVVLPTAIRTVGSALVTDLVQEESLGRGISLYAGCRWIGGIIGFAVTGYAFQKFGLTATCIVGALIPLAAAVLLVPIGYVEKEEEAANP